ncbi:hypothetical protein HNR27_001527 [Ornithinibacillus bavariensis]
MGRVQKRNRLERKTFGESFLGITFWKVALDAATPNIRVRVCRLITVIK